MYQIVPLLLALCACMYELRSVLYLIILRISLTDVVMGMPQ